MILIGHVDRSHPHPTHRFDVTCFVIEKEHLGVGTSGVTSNMSEVVRFVRRTWKRVDGGKGGRQIVGRQEHPGLG